MDRPKYAVSLSMHLDALEVLADQNELEDNDPAVKTAKTPLWAASIVQAVDDALLGDAHIPEIVITPDVYDYVAEQIHDAAASAQEGGKGQSTAWNRLVASAYIQYLDQLEPPEVVSAFEEKLTAIVREYDLDLRKLPSFREFRQHREFTHVSALPTELQSLTEGAGATEFCVTYPGQNLLGYDPVTGEGWFQDYKQEFRGPLEEIERKLYLWAIVESPTMVTDG